jgi:cytochrome P450
MAAGLAPGRRLPPTGEKQAAALAIARRLANDRGGGVMAVEARRLSLWDTARFHALVTVPASLLGLVSGNAWFASWFARGDRGRPAIRLVAELRRKYGCGHLWLWFPFAPTLLVLDPESIDAVLASADNAADPWLKKHALSRFVPDALVISSGDAWVERRWFNEAVLCFEGPLRDGDAYAEIVSRVVEQWSTQQRGHLRWADFRWLALRISHQVLLGAGQLEPEMAAQLDRMALAANALLRRPRDFAAFYDRMDGLLRRHAGTTAAAGDASAACLVRAAAQSPAAGTAGASTRVPTQIGFWFFVLRDALELHGARTLALIAAHAGAQERARREVEGVPVLTAGGIGALQFLESCIREQLRLWTPVPILLRRAVQDFTLRGAIPIKAEQQLLLLTNVHHRDPQVFGPAANRFVPETLSADFPAVYYFSGGRQSCAGQFLALFVLKATLAALLQRFRFELAGPLLEPARIPYAYDHFNIELRAIESKGNP